MRIILQIIKVSNRKADMKRFLFIILLFNLFFNTDAQAFFKYFFRYYTPAKGLPSLKVTQTAQDKNGYIWFGTASGLCRYDGQNYSNFLVKDGLPSNIVEVILADGDNLWVGTDQGLVIFNLVTEKIEKTSIKTKIYALYKDSDGLLWIASESGVGIFKDNDIKKEYKGLKIPQLVSYSFYMDNKDNFWIGTDDGIIRIHNSKDNPNKKEITRYNEDKAFTAKRVFSILQHKINNVDSIWFGTSNGLFQYSLDQGEKEQFIPISLGRGLTNITVSSIIKTKDGSLWVGYNGGVSKINTNETVSNFSRSNGLPHDSITDLLLDRENSLWISTEGGGVAKLSNDKFIHFDIKYRSESKLIYSVLESDKGNIWFGGEGIIAKLSGDEWTTVSQGTVVRGPYIKDIFLDSKSNLWFVADDITKMSPDGKAIPYSRDFFLDENEIVTSLAMSNSSKSDEIWLGTPKGIYQIWDIDIQNPVIKYHKEIFQNYHISSIIKDVKTNEKKTIKRENTTKKHEIKKEKAIESKTIKNNKKESSKKNQTKTNKKVETKKKEKDNKKNPKKDSKKRKEIKGEMEPETKAIPNKIKTAAKNRTLRPGQEEKVELDSYSKELLKDIREDGITYNKVKDIKEFLDRPKMDYGIWFSTRNHGIFHVKRDRRFVPFKGNKALENAGIHKLFLDSKGFLWALSLKGVFKINPKSAEIIHYNAGKELLENFAWSIHEDKDKNIWLATNGGGLTKIEPDGKIQTFTKKDGLSSEVIYKVLSNDDGDLWMITPQALDHFDQEAKRLINYNIENGLNGELLGETTPLYIDSQNNVWIGTTNGVTEFVAEKDIKNTVPPRIVLNSVYLNEKAYDFKNDVELSYDENNLDFHFVGLSYKDEEGVKYRYKLDGIDEHWSEWTSRPVARYSNLPDGQYTLHAQVQNQDAVQNLKNKDFKIQFSISPPFWETTWFILLSIVVIGISGYLIHKWSMKKLEDQNRVLEEKVGKRTAELSQEKDKSDKLLLNVLPAKVAGELKEKGKAVPRSYDSVTVMFTDFKGFTQIAERLSAEELVKELDLCFAFFDDVVKSNKLEKLKTIGDAYMCAGGIPSSNLSHPVDTVLAAMEIQVFMETVREKNIIEDKPFWELRLGIHTGPVMAGVVGKSKFLYDIWGDTVNLAARMESSGEPNKINISGDTYKLIKDYFHCEHRGQVPAKNKGLIDMYFVEGLKSEFRLDGHQYEPNKNFWDFYNKTIGKNGDGS